jgi:hypothetical protein
LEVAHDEVEEQRWKTKEGKRDLSSASRTGFSELRLRGAGDLQCSILRLHVIRMRQRSHYTLDRAVDEGN